MFSFFIKNEQFRAQKVPSGCPTQVDFPAWQVTFQSFCPTGMVPGKSSAN